MEFDLDQVRTALRPDSSRFELSRHVEITRTGRSQIPLRYPGCRPGRRPAASWNLAHHALSSSLAGLRPASMHDGGGKRTVDILNVYNSL